MGYLINLYVTLLKSHPIKTNLCTALVLMVGGDVLAQEIERVHLEDEFTFHPHDLDGVPPSRRLHLRPYGYVDSEQPPPPRFCGGGNDHGGGGGDRPTTSTSTAQKGEEDGSSVVGMVPVSPPTDDGVEYVPPWPDAAAIILDSVWTTVRQTDLIRSATMGGWAVMFYTPAYMALYWCYDRIFPKKNALSVLARVGGAVVYSVPVNAAFFLYGTCVHHTLEWYGLWNALLTDAEEEATWDVVDNEDENDISNSSNSNSNNRSVLATSEQQQEWTEGQSPHHRHLLGRSRFFLPLPDHPPPYDMDMMLSKAHLKIDTELITTVTNSAKMWIPINLFNFAAVPPHLRPFGLLFFSVFWNCYLSLVQHRDVPLPRDVCVECGLRDGHAEDCAVI